MPGISVITITAGPLPATCTTFVTPSRVISRRLEILERIVLVHAPFAHPPSPLR